MAFFGLWVKLKTQSLPDILTFNTWPRSIGAWTANWQKNYLTPQKKPCPPHPKGAVLTLKLNAD